MLHKSTDFEKKSMGEFVYSVNEAIGVNSFLGEIISIQLLL